VAIFVVAIGAVGLALLGPGGTHAPGNLPSPSPSAPASADPSSSWPPALTETFTSNLHGISVAFPSGWTPGAATEPWTTDDPPHQDEPFVDTIDITPSNSPFILLTSQALGGRTGDRWISERLARALCADTDAVTIDGRPGVLLAPECFDGAVALVTTDDRGYFIFLYGVDDAAWFREILATVRLHPEDAVDPTTSDPP
jgi:hypothetical protein